MKTILLIIDAQYDFCNPLGTLYVPGSENDCKKLSQFLIKNEKNIDEIYATLDTHYPYHIAHPLFWKKADGTQPDYYTIISSKDIEAGTYTPADSSQQEWALHYVKELERKGKYQLCIWPPHCLMGSLGQTVEKTVYSALTFWQENHIGKHVEFITKANTPITEQYSAIQAEVPVENEESTHTNTKLIEALKKADNIFVAGEALSHCVANTVRDLLEYIPAEKFTLLSDCCSNVTGFDDLGKNFTSDFEKAGGKVIKSTD